MRERSGLTPLRLRTALQDALVKMRGDMPSRESFLKIAAVLVAGLWTLSMYFAHEREQQRLAIEHEKLSNQMLANALTQFAATARLDLARAQLANQGQSLDNRLKGLALQEATTPRIKITHDIDMSVSDKAARLYDGMFQVRVDNISRSQVELSWALFETYLGTTDPAMRENTIVGINAPPRHELGQEDGGAVSWVLQWKQGFYLAGSKFLDRKYFTARDYFKEGGGPTKSLAAGDYADYQIPLLVRAKSDRWVAVVAILGVDGAVRGPNVYVASDWIDLRSAGTATRAAP